MKKLSLIPLIGGAACVVIYSFAVLLTYLRVLELGIFAGIDMPPLTYAATQWWWIAAIGLVMIMEGLVTMIVQHIRERRQ